MIPYPLFMFRIIWPDDVLDVRALEPVKNGFTFRVARNRQKDMKRLAKYIVSFLNVKTKAYTEYEISGSISPEGDIYKFTSEDERFNKDFQKMLNEYMKVIRLKLENDEIEAMESMSGFSVSDEFWKDVKEWKRELCKPKTTDNASLHNIEIAIVLDNDKLWNNYLKLSFDEFMEYYWEENCLKDFQITKKTITHIYIGNQFCPYLFPQDGLIIEIIRKINGQGITPVVVLAPQPESLIDKLTDTLITLENTGNFNVIELVVNDFGTAELIKSLRKEGKLEGDYKLTAGVLLNKRKKDPRGSFLTNKENLIMTNSRNCWNDSEYADYVSKNFGIKMVSCEASGNEFEPGVLPSVLHLPSFQISTSNCVMNSLWDTGKRGIRGDLNKCPHICTDKYIYYPKNSGLMGIGNSVFGVSDWEINDFAYLNKLIDNGLKRLVIRL